jgi:hypothetical protein
MFQICEELDEYDFLSEIFKYVLENVFNENTMYYSNHEEIKDVISAENEAKLIFYENLHNVKYHLKQLINHLPIDTHNKLLNHRVFRIFSEDPINKQIVGAFIENLNSIISHEISFQNYKFLDEYVKNFNTIKDCILKVNNWRKISQLINVHSE